VINTARPGDEAGRKVTDMNAYTTLGLVLSSSLLALAACGTSTLGGGSGGGAGTGAGTGTGSTCGTTTGPITDPSFPVACVEDIDCIPVFLGDTCPQCACPNTAISSAAMDQYNQYEQARQAACCGGSSNVCPCPAFAVACQQGTCALVKPIPGLCGGQPSSVSCTANSCPPGYICVKDADPTTCHSSSCACTANGWACTADCGMNGSSCVKGM
jgi:hypothetical protein